LSEPGFCDKIFGKWEGEGMSFETQEKLKLIDQRLLEMLRYL
jgi:hypothetical protein